MTMSCLAVPFALGVDEINADPTTCWHLGKPGQRGTAVTLNYLSALEADDSHLRFKHGFLAVNQELWLKVLGKIMHWTDYQARQEFAWLSLMARLKYDGYRDFQAGMRFIESLATWLQQFNELAEREAAYAFVRHALVYIGPGEIRRLVEQFYPRTVQDRIVRTVSIECGTTPYRVLVDAKAVTATARLRRQILFMGLSDGARIDTIRHTNSAALSNEQLVQGTQVDVEKWKDLLDNLRADLGDSKARFRLIYLIDDFAGTGTSFLRFDDDMTKWKGKLIRFKDSIEMANKALAGDKLLEDRWELCIHHYVASWAAVQRNQGTYK